MHGIVEVFDALGYAKAKYVYAWSHREGPGNEGERFVAVIGLPPVDSPQTAVKSTIASEARSEKTGHRDKSMRKMI